MTGTLTVHVGDTHIGGTTSLCPPTVQLDRAGTYNASPTQAWFHECWSEFWQDTARLKRDLHCHVLAIFGGDLRDGDHHQTTELWSANEGDQDAAVLQVLELARPVLDMAVFVRGTRAHSGPASSAEEGYAKLLAGRGWPIWGNGPQSSWWIWTGIIEGVKFQVKHKPATSSRVPSKADGAAGRQAEYLAADYRRKQQEPPDIAVFHHVHYRARGFFEGLYCHYCPSWQMPTNWAMENMSSPLIEPPGGLRLYCKDGVYTPYELRFTPPGGTAWTK